MVVCVTTNDNKPAAVTAAAWSDIKKASAAPYHEVVIQEGETDMMINTNKTRSDDLWKDPDIIEDSAVDWKGSIW